MSRSLFIPGKNCWRVSQIREAALLVDCANFYRALHDSIVKAKKSIFIVGWDIDSRIRLIRGKDEAEAKAPSVAGDLLAWKARQNPEMKIYLLRWDSSITFLNQRELQPMRTWEANTPENVHVWLDNTIPCGGSHHQKIILIDDEIAFTGGMDIACGRWDEREHRPHEPERYDHGGPYSPYHDVQIVSYGPVVKDLSDLVRWRWQHGAGYEAIEFAPSQEAFDSAPPTWPLGLRPSFQNFECAIARTIPWMGKDQPPAHEIHQMYLDVIEEAKSFIYIENQFFAFEPLAKAINSKLKRNPKLRVLMVGPYEPKGIFEREGLWASRIDFRKIVEDGVDKARVRMTYPVVNTAEGESQDKRIHSKIFCVDDTYMIVASSNITRRSMTVDTESDLILYAQTPEQREQLRAARNDLIAEHLGKSEESIERYIRSGCSLDTLLESEKEFGPKLLEIEDHKFTNQSLQSFARPLADPEEPLLPSVFPLNAGKVRPMRNPRRDLLLIAVAALVILGSIAAYIATQTDWISPENLESFLASARGTPWALPLICLTYLVGGLLMFPVTLLSLVTTAVWGVVWGPIYAMCGALVSGAFLYWIGHLIGIKGLRSLFGERIRSLVKKLEKRGVMGIVVIRMTPIAPYTLVNLAAGIVSLRFLDYIVGTFLGLLPGLIAKGFVGDSLMQVLLNPSSESFLYVVLGIGVWLAIVWASQRLVNYLVKKAKGDSEPSESASTTGAEVPCP